MIKHPFDEGLRIWTLNLLSEQAEKLRYFTISGYLAEIWKFNSNGCNFQFCLQWNFITLPSSDIFVLESSDLFETDWDHFSPILSIRASIFSPSWVWSSLISTVPLPSASNTWKSFASPSSLKWKETKWKSIQWCTDLVEDFVVTNRFYPIKLQYSRNFNFSYYFLILFALSCQTHSWKRIST